MKKIEPSLWERYIRAIEREKEAFDKYDAGHAVIDEIQTAQHEVFELHDLCVTLYCDTLAQIPEEDWVTVYFDDIKDAAGADDLHMLRVLEFIPARSGLIVPVEVDVFLLSYYVGFFKRAKDSNKIVKAQLLFEQVLDTSEPDLDIYTWAIDEIFSMNSGEEWYVQFYRGIEKLLLQAPINQETLYAMKKGLTGTNRDIKERIEGIIAYAYENRRKISVLQVQRDETDIIAGMHFETGAEPEIGMELRNDDVICRIEDFHTDYGMLYNCLVTVIKGELTPGISFEVEIR